LGCIYGNALGDALGLATEFLTKQQTKSIYGDGPIPFPYFKRNGHNSRWDAGDWTDDTDQLILILETILENNGQVSEIIFAKKLRDWVHNGFPDLGDSGGMGLGATVGAVVSSRNFLLEPHKASKQVWLQMNKNAAANGAVMRTAILGCLDYKDTNKVVDNTIRMCQVTHHDSRCVASCVAVTVAIALMLQGHEVASDAEIQDLIAKSLEHAHAHLDAEFFKEFDAHILRDSTEKSLYSLQLDEQAKIGYTMKCVGSGFWGLNSTRNFKETLTLLAKEAGDADTNGAVCGALLGCKMGYSELPQDWLGALPNKAWLDKKVVKLLEMMKLI